MFKPNRGQADAPPAYGGDGLAGGISSPPPVAQPYINQSTYPQSEQQAYNAGVQNPYASQHQNQYQQPNQYPPQNGGYPGQGYPSQGGYPQQGGYYAPGPQMGYQQGGYGGGYGPGYGQQGVL
jgi:hypothetical protein